MGEVRFDRQDTLIRFDEIPTSGKFEDFARYLLGC